MSIFSKLKKRLSAENQEVSKETSKVEAGKKTNAKGTKTSKKSETVATPSKKQEAVVKKSEAKEKSKGGKKTLLQILKNPAITEKSARMQENGEYVFDVALHAKKPTIAAAVRERYGVDVVAVRTLRRRGKNVSMGRTYGKRSDVKKAIVRVAAGQSIQIFEQEEVK